MHITCCYDTSNKDNFIQLSAFNRYELHVPWISLYYVTIKVVCTRVQSFVRVREKLVSELISVLSKLDSISADLWPENILNSFLFDKKSFPQYEALIIDVIGPIRLVNGNSASTILSSKWGRIRKFDPFIFWNYFIFVFFWISVNSRIRAARKRYRISRSDD